MSDEALYTTAAQVIPVLILALFIEDRVSNKQPTKSHSADQLAVLALLLLGEMTAITALADKPRELSEGVVILAICYGFLFLLVPPLRRLIAQTASPERVGEWYLAAVVALGVLTFTVGPDAVPYLAFGLFVLLSAVAGYHRVREDLAERRETRRPSRTLSDTPANSSPSAAALLVIAFILSALRRGRSQRM